MARLVSGEIREGVVMPDALSPVNDVGSPGAGSDVEGCETEIPGTGCAPPFCGAGMRAFTDGAAERDVEIARAAWPEMPGNILLAGSGGKSAGEPP